MENSNATAVPGLEFWVQWQVLVCGLIILLATVAAFILIRDRPSGAGVSPLKPTDLWAPCWRNLHPRWLLLFRGFAFATMAFLLYLTVVDFGSLAFFFYTQLSDTWESLTLDQNKVLDGLAQSTIVTEAQNESVGIVSPISEQNKQEQPKDLEENITELRRERGVRARKIPSKFRGFVMGRGR